MPCLVSESHTHCPMTYEEDNQAIARFDAWHHSIEFPSGAMSPGRYNPGDLLRRLDLADLNGKRVLDLGTRDGYFAFECEKRGARVVALDYCPPKQTGFPIAKRIYKSRVRYRQGNIYNLASMRLGTFDVVLCLGLLYHLRHPLLALDQIRKVCSGTLYVESLVADHSFFRTYMQPGQLAEHDPDLTKIPVAQFLPKDTYHADWTNRWSPNLACLQALVEDALFDVTDTQVWGDRALVRATVSSDPARAGWNAIDSGLWTHNPTKRKPNPPAPLKAAAG